MTPISYALRRWPSVASAWALVLLTAGTVEARQREGPAEPRRPFSGLFQGAPTVPLDTASVLLSGYGGYDNDRSSRGEEGDGSGLAGDGPYSGIDLDFSYTPRQRGRVGFDARGTTSLRYYTNLSDFVAATQTATAGASMRLSQRATLQARGGVAYTPYFDFTVLPGMEEPGIGPEATPRIPDNTVRTRRVLTYDGALDLTHAPSDRTSLSFRYATRATELLDEGRRTLDHTASAAVSHRLSRRSAARVTYVHRDGQHQVANLDGPVRVDDVEIGFDRDWARSATRRTVLTVALGPSIVEQRDQRFYRAFGGVTVTHPFARTWNIRALYRRGVQFVDGTEQPYFSDSATVGLSGLLTRRLDLSASVGAVLGDLGLEGAVTPFDTYSASTRFRFGMTRTLAVYGEYLYNYSKYSGGAANPGGLPGLDRQSVRVGLSLYVPVMQERTRRTGQ